MIDTTPIIEIREPKRHRERDPKTGRWLNTNATSYSAIHKWLTKNYGNPSSCEDCGREKYTDKKGRCGLQWANLSGEYKRDIKDYKGLCISCHKVHDKIINNIKWMRKRNG